MRILILGGTGAMGIHLVDLLSIRPDMQIIVTSRSKRESRDNVSYVQGNGHDLNFLSLLLKEKYDVIVDFMKYSTEEFQKRYQQLLAACEQYVYLSSSRVYADSDTLITEDSPRLLDVITDTKYLATDEYALAKARQENLLLNSSYTNWTIIRPYITYSENRLQLGVLEKENWLYRALHGRTIVFSKDIAGHLTTLTYGLDVANGISAIIGREEAKGEAFHITAPESICWKDVLSIYLEIIEEQLGKCPNVLMEDQSYKLQYALRQYQVKYDRCFDNSKISRFIDVNAFRKPYNGLRSCLIAFLQNPVFKTGGFGDEAIFDRLTGERTSWSEIPSLKQKIKYSLYKYIIK